MELNTFQNTSVAFFFLGHGPIFPKSVCERLPINWRAEQAWFGFQAINTFQVQKDLQDPTCLPLITWARLSCLARGEHPPFPEGGAASAGWRLSAHTLPGTAAGAHPWRRPATVRTWLPTGSPAQPVPETAAKRTSSADPWGSHSHLGKPIFPKAKGIS